MSRQFVPLGKGVRPQPPREDTSEVESVAPPESPTYSAFPPAPSTEEPEVIVIDDSSSEEEGAQQKEEEEEEEEAAEEELEEEEEEEELEEEEVEEEAAEEEELEEEEAGGTLEEDIVFLRAENEALLEELKEIPRAKGTVLTAQAPKYEGTDLHRVYRHLLSQNAALQRSLQAARETEVRGERVEEEEEEEEEEEDEAEEEDDDDDEWLASEDEGEFEENKKALEDFRKFIQQAESERKKDRPPPTAEEVAEADEAEARKAAAKGSGEAAPRRVALSSSGAAAANPLIPRRRVALQSASTSSGLPAGGETFSSAQVGENVTRVTITGAGSYESEWNSAFASGRELVLDVSARPDSIPKAREDQPPFRKIVLPVGADVPDDPHPTKCLEFVVDSYEPDWTKAQDAVDKFRVAGSPLTAVYIRQAEGFKHKRQPGTKKDENFWLEFGTEFVEEARAAKTALWPFLDYLSQMVRITDFALIGARGTLYGESDPRTEDMSALEIGWLMKAVSFRLVRVVGFKLRGSSTTHLVDILSKLNREQYLDVTRMDGATPEFLGVVREHNANVMRKFGEGVAEGGPKRADLEYELPAMRGRVCGFCGKKKLFKN
jgi:hypothetical protein